VDVAWLIGGGRLLFLLRLSELLERLASTTTDLDAVKFRGGGKSSSSAIAVRMRSRRDGRWRRSRSSRLVRKGHIVRCVTYSECKDVSSAARSLTVLYVQQRSKRTSVSMRSFRASPKENGRMWHHCASSHSTLNVKVERGTFLRQSMTQ